MKNLKAKIIGAAVLYAFVSLCGPSFGEEGRIFKYIDEHGNVHFVDSEDKIPSKYRARAEDHEPGGSLSIVETPEPPARRDPPAASPRRNEQRLPSKKGFRADAKVELYATSWCGYCEKARQWFRSHEIKFTEYDIEKDEAAAERMKRLSRQGGVPVVVIDGSVAPGYSVESYERLLQE